MNQQITDRLAAALEKLLTFHPEDPETGAELSPEWWSPDYRAAVEDSKAVLEEYRK